MKIITHGSNARQSLEDAAAAMRDCKNTNLVHIWTVDIGDSGWDKHLDSLSHGDLMTAACLRGNELQVQQKRSRGALRALLGRYANRQPSAIEFRYGEWGKPEVLDLSLCFNLSHSNNHALIAVGSKSIGVDIESIRMLEKNVTEMADYICDPNEKRSLSYLPGTARLLQFFQIWVRKEAYLKAVGIGLRGRLCDVSFSLKVSEMISQVIDDSKRGKEVFYAYDLDIFDNYAACVCTSLSAANIEVLHAHPNVFMQD